MMMKNAYLLILSVFMAITMSAQQGVGIGTTMPNSKSILELSSTTKGLLIPRMSSAQRNAISSPPQGLMVFQNNGTLGFWYHDGSIWQRFAKASELTGSSSWTVAGDHQYSNVDGNVGIGMSTSISEKLTLKGNMMISYENAVIGDPSSAVLKLHTSSLGTARIDFLRQDSIQRANISMAPLLDVLSIENSLDNSGAIRLYDNGKVGIGTSLTLDATSKLQILGGEPANYTTQNGYIQLGSSSGLNLALSHYEILARDDGASSPLYLQHDGGAVRIGNSGATANTRLHITDGQEVNLTSHGYVLLGTVNAFNLVLDNDDIQSRNNGAAASLVVQRAGGAFRVGADYKLNVAADGDVGIGTSSPAERLHVEGNGLFNGTNPTIQLRNSNVDKAYFQLSGDNVRTGTNSGNVAGKFIIRMNGTDRVFVDPGGNVGIGTSSPLAKLDVAGRIRVVQGGEAIGVDGNDPQIRMWHNGSLHSWIAQYANETFIGSYDKIHIDGDQVAIGSVQSSADDYKLTVSGKVICEELKVELVGTWPDYVFAEKYNLTPLHELKSFINTHQHLPNIPKASDIQKDGFEVGEMNRKLLEKVEELTLYIIQQEERIESLNGKVIELDALIREYNEK